MNLKSRWLSWVEHVAHMEQSRNTYRVLVGRYEGKRPLGKLSNNWEENNEIDLMEVGCNARNWLDLGQDRD